VAATTLRLGTRGSALARAQASMVARDLEARHPGLAVELVLIRTTGDKLQRGPLAPAGGKGLFVKELEEALAAETIDFAVHSMKDVPALVPEAFALVAVPPRADARDVLVSHGDGLAALPEGARIGTASVRRRAQLLARRRDLDVTLLRGNVDTRLQRGAPATSTRSCSPPPASRGSASRSRRAAAPDRRAPPRGRAGGARARMPRRRHGHAHAARGPGRPAVGGGRGRGTRLPSRHRRRLQHAARRACDRHGRSLVLRAQVSDLDGTRFLEDAIDGAAADAVGLGRALADRLLARGAGALIGR
jgi:hydroxymethylbilane synthase